MFQDQEEKDVLQQNYTLEGKIDRILKHVETIDEEMKSVKTKTALIVPMEKDIVTMKSQINNLQEEIDRIKKRERENILIVFRVPDNDEINGSLRPTIINALQNINKDVTDDVVISVTRLGKVAGNRPILIRFTMKHIKLSMFRFTKEFRELGIAIGDDLSRDQREQRKRLLQFFPALREKGFAPKIRGDKILIGQTLHDAEHIPGLIGDLAANALSNASQTLPLQPLQRPFRQRSARGNSLSVSRNTGNNSNAKPVTPGKRKAVDPGPVGNTKLTTWLFNARQSSQAPCKANSTEA